MTTRILGGALSAALLAAVAGAAAAEGASVYDLGEMPSREACLRRADKAMNAYLNAHGGTSIEVAEAYVDDCVAAHAEGTLTAVDAAKAKWWSAQVQNDVLDECVQLHGGYGFMNEYRVARAWRDARVTKIWAGSNEIMKELIGRDLGF